MDSKELAKLVDLGATHSCDGLVVVRHGKIVAEACYAPYAAGISHLVYSVTKAVISTLTAIAFKHGLLDSPSHRVLDFFDRGSIANVDERKEAITVQNLLDMTSGFDWTQPLTGGTPTSLIEMQRSPDWVKYASIQDRRDHNGNIRWRRAEPTPARLRFQRAESATRSSEESSRTRPTGEPISNAGLHLHLRLSAEAG
jgi:CubicO group peptidase (beta-lactamase class C family)